MLCADMRGVCVDCGVGARQVEGGAMMIGVGIVIGLLFGGLIGFVCGVASKENRAPDSVKRDLLLMARNMLAPGNVVRWEGNASEHQSYVLYYDQDRHHIVVKFAGGPHQITYDQLRGQVLAEKGDLEKL